MVHIHKKVVNNKGWQNFLVCSDLHYGEKHCDLSRFKRDLEEAKRIKARIIFNGDILGMILPTDSKRFQQSCIEVDGNENDNIINRTVSNLADILLPYVEFVDVIGMGNHEYSMVKHHNIDVTELLINELMLKALKSKKKCNISHGSITGYITYQFNHHGSRKLFNIWYHHGRTGGGQNKGIIDMQRVRQSHLADLYITGHCHNSWGDRDIVSLVNASGNIEKREQRLIKSGNYRKGSTVVSKGQESNIDYSELKGYAEKARGGVFFKVKLVREGSSAIFEQRVEI